MAKISIRLTRSAAEKSRNQEVLKRAALAAFEQAGRGDILCLPFEASGQRFALSSRMVIEVLPAHARRLCHHTGRRGGIAGVQFPP